MSALNTNKFRKKKSLYIGNLEVGVNDTDTTLDFTSLAGLPIDTAITLTLDRVDANGDRTPTLMERVTGVVSGDSLINCIRGVDNTTAKSHDAGAVLEDIWEAGTWNDLVDGILVGHGQLGEHTSDLVTSLKATGATVNTGTSDVTIVTPKAIADSNLSYTDGTEVLTNKTITSSTNLISFNAPQGFLINGKIVPSVSSNNLTVAIKGMNGSDPSSTNPVYCRIGNTIQTLTAALSVTATAGTNWLAMGSSEIATREVDLFVYLVWNTTANPDQLTLGFSRIPCARVYADFYPDRSHSRGMYQNDSPFAADTDEVEVIGRFAATLSAGSGYTWTVPTFTAINLIQKPIYSTRRLVYTPSNPTGTGSITTQTVTGAYYISNNMCWAFVKVILTTNGGTAGTDFRPTLPITFESTVYQGDGSDDTAGTGLFCSMSMLGSTTAFIARTMTGGYPGASGHNYNMQICGNLLSN